MCSPFAFSQSTFSLPDAKPVEYTPPVDVAGPSITEERTTLVEVATGSPQVTTSQSSQLAELVLLTQQLAAEVRELRGTVEQQGFELRRLQQQRLDDYRDFDQRIAALDAPIAASNTPAVTPNNTVADAVANSTTTGAVATISSEKDAYRAAYNLVKAREFKQAVPAFNAFLTQYPSGSYAGNAYYWLGELYVLDNDYTAAQASMEALVAQFPKHRKVPDAYYKLAKLYQRLGDDAKAKALAQKVVNEYANQSDTVARLAQDFLNANYPE